MGVADEQLISEAYRRVERIGYSVGAALFERRSGDRLFQDPLDAMKFICKEFWPLFYQKQIDNLKTNHRDSAFRPLGNCVIPTDGDTSHNSEISYNSNGDGNSLLLSLLSAFPASIIRGALNNSGYAASVSAEIILPSTVSIRIELNLGGTSAAAAAPSTTR